jgi:Cu+-exporting ATPase
MIERKQTMAMVKDVVCGMTVDIATAEHKSEYKGRIYYFCSAGCKRSFDREPEKYVRSESSGVGGSHNSHALP